MKELLLELPKKCEHLACSRLRDGGGKSFSNKKCKKRAGAGDPAATAPFPKSCASYFRFARFNTFLRYYLRAWHRLVNTRLRTQIETYFRLLLFEWTEKTTEIHLRLHEFRWILLADDSLLS